MIFQELSWPYPTGSSSAARLDAAGHPSSLPEAAFGRNRGAPWVKYVAGEHDMSAGDFIVISVMKRMN